MITHEQVQARQTILRRKYAKELANSAFRYDVNTAQVVNQTRLALLASTELLALLAAHPELEQSLDSKVAKAETEIECP